MATLQRGCGAHDNHSALLAKSEEYRTRQRNLELQTARRDVSPFERVGVTIIDCVVHVISNSAATNISKAQIDSQIDVLNRDFRATNNDIGNVPPVFQSLVADPRLEFRLASRDPSGNATDGVTRKTTTKNFFTASLDDCKAGPDGTPPWPIDAYLNIWVVPDARGNDGRTILGYAQFPGGPAATDGVVILHSAFGTNGTAAAPFNLGRTTTHEIGHYLNLRHIWGDDRGACTGSDLVADTPNQAGPNFGAPNFPSVTCGNGPNGDLFMNYMDYVDDRAMFMFTADQVARMQAALDGPRSQIGVPKSKWLPVATNDPAWSDAQGWADFSNYSTIQAVAAGPDLYLLARANAGMITLRYDPANDLWERAAINDPTWSDGQGWNDFSNYSTIQAVSVGRDLYLLARANAGIVSLKLPAGTDRWQAIASNDPRWADSNGWADFSNYSTIQAVGTDSKLFLLARANAGMICLVYNPATDRWDDAATNDPAWSDNSGWGDFSNYSTIQATHVGDELYLTARANAGMVTLRLDQAGRRWVQIARNDPAWGDNQGWGDFSNYSTIQMVGSTSELYLLARANAGMVTLRYDGGGDRWVAIAVNDPAWSDNSGWNDFSNYSTIKAVTAGASLFLTARANAGMHTLRYDAGTDRWQQMAANDPAWSDAQGWADPTNYRTIMPVGVGNDLFLLARANAGMVTLKLNQ